MRKLLRPKKWTKSQNLKNLKKSLEKNTTQSIDDGLSQAMRPVLLVPQYHLEPIMVKRVYERLIHSSQVPKTKILTGVSSHKLPKAFGPLTSHIILYVTSMIWTHLMAGIAKVSILCTGQGVLKYFRTPWYRVIQNFSPSTQRFLGKLRRSD